MSKFLKHSAGSTFRRKCLHREHTPACFIIVIVGIKCYKCNLFDIHIKDGLHKPLRITSRGFPAGAVVENLPANAGDTGLGPGMGRSHVPRSNWAREPQLLSLSVWSLCSATREAAIVRGPCTAKKSDPHLPQLEKALAQKRRPNTANK